MEGSDRVTIRDVAVEADVGISTVSRVINHPSKVASHTRERVLDVMRDMDYAPNDAAKRLGKRRSREKSPEPAKIVRENVDGAFPSVIFEGRWTHREQVTVSEAIADRDGEGPWLCVKSQVKENVFFAVVHLEGAKETATGVTFSELISQVRSTTG